MDYICASIDPGIKNLGIVLFSFTFSENRNKIFKSILCSKTLDISFKKNKKTLNANLYDTIYFKLNEIINFNNLNYVIIESQMSRNPKQLRIQAILYSLFRTINNERNLDINIIEVSAHNKLNWFSETDIIRCGYKIKPKDPNKKHQSISSRITRTTKKNIAIKYCSNKYNIKMTEHEADAFLQALVYFNIND